MEHTGAGSQKLGYSYWATVMARYGGTGPLEGILDVRIDQLIGDLIHEEDENHDDCRYLIAI